MEKKKNGYIRKEADDLLKGKLRNLFDVNKMNLYEHEASGGEDNGTDFFFDVTTENENHDFFFKNQNKGTLNLNRKKEEFISYQISMRNVTNYYYEFDEALIFTICDLKNKTIYWYDIQNDVSLGERIKTQINNGKSTIQIHIPIENVLNEETFDNFIEKIQYSRYSQIRKKNILSENLDVDYSTLEYEIKDKHIIDKIHYVVKLFENFIVLPNDVLGQLPPFKFNGKNAIIDNYNLKTENIDLYDFINSINLENDEFNLKSNEVFVDNQSGKIKEIISFLRVNLINHIYCLRDKKLNKICVHDLFKNKTCDCVRCNLERLDIKKTNLLLAKKVDKSSSYDLLKKGYTYYLLGEYKKSCEIFLDIHHNSLNDKNPITYTIATHNLVKLKNLIYYSYHIKDTIELVKRLNSIEFNNDERFIFNKAPHFLNIFKDIKLNRFYDSARREIDKCYDQIQKISYGDKNGISYNSNAGENLQYYFLKFSVYLEHNFIIFNQYSEYKTLSKKVLESIFALYKLRNSDSLKYQNFSWNIINMWIFDVDESDCKYLLSKYEIDKIEINNNTDIIHRINELVENLINSNEYTEGFFEISKPIKIDKILNKILLITSLLNVEFSVKDRILLNVIKLCKLFKDNKLIPYNNLIYFVENNENDICKNRINQILDLFSNVDFQWIYYDKFIQVYEKKASPLEMVHFIEKNIKIIDIENTDFNSGYIDLNNIFNSYTYLSIECKSKITESLRTKLYKNFDSDLYNYSCLYDFIDYEENLFKQYIDLVPDFSNIDINSHLYYLDSYENMFLNSVINLIYKYDIVITDDLKCLALKSHEKYFDYYTWLLDIDNFDYSKFNPYWIMQFQSIYYINRFRKSIRLKEEVSKKINQNYIEGVAKLYFKIFA